MKYEKTVAPEIIKTSSTAKLLDLWDETEAAEMAPELPIVRGWIMDELEARDPAGFDAWMEDEDPAANPRKHITAPVKGVKI